MKQKLILFSFYIFLTGGITFAQEQLTEKEQAYRDSIAALNEENAAIAASQEAYNKGIELFNKKDYRKAIEAFKTSIASDPNFTAAYYNKGVAENEADLFSEAAQTLSELIEKDPAYSKAYFQRARAFQGTGEYTKAELDYKKSI